MSAQLALLLVDGHSRVRSAFVYRIRLVPAVEAVYAASTLEEAARVVSNHAPDVVLYDPRTVAGAAPDAIRLLVQSGCRVVIFTSSLRDGEDLELTRAGAATIVFKGIGVNALLDRLHAVLPGRHNSSPPGTSTQ